MARLKEQQSELDAAARLKRAATELFSQKGYDATSTREIAERAGVNLSLIRYYFKGKEGLYRRLLSDYAEISAAGAGPLLAHLETIEPTPEQLHALFKGLLLALIEQRRAFPELSRILQREWIAGLPHAQYSYDETFSRVADRLAMLLEQAASAQVLRPVNAYSVILMLLNCVEMHFAAKESGISWTKKIMQLPEQSELFAEETATMLLAGIKN
ncbi:MAG: TetR/AcrR family transcriptional regulator [Leptonema illini]|uniref:TetR/AcrR family transcriptional regulator n=1 Tax=Leptonema illini TaxID=183 RepID=A0A833GW93_9LEPT|nr:MAG: TetR/AcrR family transcriptional regulator [Leptonema illini]